MRQAKKVGLLNKIMKLEPGQVEFGLEWKKRRFAVDFVTTSFKIAKLNKSTFERSDAGNYGGALFYVISSHSLEELATSQASNTVFKSIDADIV